MKKFILAFFILFLLFGCAQNTTSNQPPANQGGQNNSSPPSGNAASVSISNFAFNPQQLTVAKGTTVQWTNNDSVAHSVNSDLFNSPLISTGQSFEFTFNSTGSFDYHCAVHPSMTGTIIVQ